MATFHLKVMTVDRCFYDDEVDRIVIRTTQGDVGILPNHVPYIAAIGIGGLTIYKDGEKRMAAVAGGFVDVSREQTVVLARTCEWAGTPRTAPGSSPGIPAALFSGRCPGIADPLSV